MTVGLWMLYSVDDFLSKDILMSAVVLTVTWMDITEFHIIIIAYCLSCKI